MMGTVDSKEGKKSAPASYEKVLDSLRRLCSAREYAPKDVRDKALARLGDTQAAEKVLNALTQEGFVDERRYASAFVSDKSSLQGWGIVKIRFALKAKGLGDDVISAALVASDKEKSADRLRHLLAAKYKSLPRDGKERIKLLKFALSRGYLYDEADAVLREILPD